ncbi:MAG: LptF/LptG family permease [Bacteroidota bacterium]
MKILDRYILTTYLRTFTSVFVILMFIFVLQTIWLYISELAGKDLDIIVVGKFLLYFAPKMIPLVLPLTILLASIMVFGNFAENYEFAAMKSTGISLQRAMRALSVFIFALSIVAFFFANNVIPWAEYNSYNLRRNIAKVKPAMAIAEGQFNEIGNINIKVEEKSGDRGQFLKNVVIHQKKSVKRGNYTVIIADNGELISSIDSNILQLELRDGNYYDELVSNDVRKYINTKPHARSYFEKYIINVDLEGLNNNDLEEKSVDSRYNMLDISGLNYTIDSLYNDRETDYKNLSNTLYNRSTYATLAKNIEPKQDTTFTGDDVMDLFDNKTKVQLLNLALNTVTSTNQILDTNQKTFAKRSAWLNRHIIALHEKYVLAIACVILFFVGAPLGALIKKGGLGLPMVIAILLFLTYHFIGIFSKNSSKDGTLHPIFATWLSTLIMLPLSIYLTSRATNDRGLFEMDYVLAPLKKWFSFRGKSVSDKNLESFNYFNNYSIDQLINVIKDQKEYDLDKRPK